MRQLLYGCLLFISSAMAMIPREKLISDSAIENVQLSADGTTVGFIALDANKIRNMFTLRLSDGLKQQVTFEESHVKYFQWTGVKKVIIFAQDTNGDENVMLFKKNISESTRIKSNLYHKSVAISQNPNVTAAIKANDKTGTYFLVAMNDVIQQFHNIYKFDLLTNELSLIFTNTRFQSDYIYADNNMNIRFAGEELDDGGMVYYRVSPNSKSSMLTSDDDQWEEYYRVKPDDVPVTRYYQFAKNCKERTNNTVPLCTYIGFDETNENVYWIVGEDTDLGKLIVTPFSDFTQQKVLHKASQGELQSFLFHPGDNTLLAFAEYYHKPRLVIHNKAVVEDIEFISNLRPEDSLAIVATSRNISTWLYTYLSWERPNEIFVYHRPQQTTEFLFHLNSDLEGYTLNKQIGFDFVASDGLRIQAYLSLPPNKRTKSAAEVTEEDKPFADLGMIPVQPQKMVLLVHGGPRHRDTYGFDARVAHLTSRGYAVMQVNFRASTGFGKKHTMAGNGEWSRKMHTDLLDAVDFAVAKGIANRSQVAIMGASYGGYATLVGMTFTPDVFACGVDIVGPANLITLMETIPPYWAGYRNSLVKVSNAIAFSGLKKLNGKYINLSQQLGGDPETEEGRQELMARSPVFIASHVKKPLMIMQRANDPIVKQDESEQFVAEMKIHSIPVTHVLYPDEGHGFKKKTYWRSSANLLAQFGFVERFLHNCLGGEYEPFTNGQYNESAIVKSGGF